MHLTPDHCTIGRHQPHIMKAAAIHHASAQTDTRRLARMLRTLRATAPAMKVELDHGTPWELLVATILSAQCTDQRVNQVTPALFRRYRRPQDYVEADPTELEALIRPTGFFKTKARNLIHCAKAVVETFHGQVPDTMETLTGLPGVGRKTANVLMGNAFDKPAIVVDTHVKRVAWRLHLTRQTDPEKVEMDLQRLLPAEEWTDGSQRLLLHGRYVCLARSPKCAICAIYSDCHWEGKLTR